MLKRSLIFNLFLASLVVVGLLVLFFNSLDWLTNHGKETTVPKVEGKNLKDVVKLLKKQGFEIEIDSTYQAYKNPLEVIFQEPVSGATVKVGRTIFLTVNRSTPPSIPMPNLVGISFRNALLTMQSFRLAMGDTIYKPDLATGSVLEQQYNGKSIRPGMMVPVGSKIDLVIAEGFSGAIEVPALVGMMWKDVSALLDSLVLTPNAVWEGEITDSAHAMVYSQTPEPINELDFKNSINQGDLIDIRIMQNPSQELLLQNMGGSRKFLGNDEVMVDSNDVPLGTTTPSALNNDMGTKDTTRKKRPVPGTQVPNSAKRKVEEPEDDKTNIDKKKTLKSKKVSDKENNSKDNGVSSKTEKPTKPKTTKPKSTSEKPVKTSDDEIKNEYD